MTDELLSGFGDELDPGDPEKVAVIGMAGRYPEAPDLETFWQNLLEGRDCLHDFSDRELDELGIPRTVHERENFVRRGTRLPYFDEFDAELFAMSPREAAITDPQARILLEVTVSALEHAGYDPFSMPRDVGVFAGCNPIDYALLLGRADATDSLTAFDQMIGNDRDFLATRIAHRLNLTGPAINVQSACSTSLVAVHLAAQHLLDHHCSIALAGGVSVNLRQGVGYFYQQGMILSKDGFCRAFDDDANGTTLGQGAGLVVLKRLSEAIADGDTIHAVIAGSAINNDGSNKVSYSAPSVVGQAEVIALAQAVAGVTADDITYVEAHGTGTKLGDPVEVKALTQAFRQTSHRNGFCHIGSVKTNTGHTDAAAGITGFIKAVLAVRDAKLPPSLHFKTPNRAIDFENSPFLVADRLIDWVPDGTDLRRAGVSSFGIGGTNAHVIVEQAPEPEAQSAPLEHPYVLAVSGHSARAADAAMEEALRWARDGRVGRSELEILERVRPLRRHRRIQVVDPHATDIVHGMRPRSVEESLCSSALWMFSGQGAQFPGMADAYGRLGEFTSALDEVLELLERKEGLELRPLLLARRDDAAAAARLQQTETTQPALFAVQYAMARQLLAWGQTPDALLGHSVGEFSAATVAGILNIEDAVSVIAARGRLMQSMETGVMVATRLGAAELAPLLTSGIELAVANSSRASVAGGSAADVDKFCQELAARGIAHARLATSHAFHTASMDEASMRFAEVLQSVELLPPVTPMLSNVTGTWLRADEATDPYFWAGQIRRTVRFDRCLDVVAAEKPDALLIELGPGRALGSFAKSHDSFETSPATVSLLGADHDRRPGDISCLEGIGMIWATGLDVDWEQIHGSWTGRRVPAPPSGFDRARLWLPEARHVLALPDSGTNGQPDPPAGPAARADISRWCYGRSWRRAATAPGEPGCVLVLAGPDQASQAIVAELRKTVRDLEVVTLADHSEVESGLVAAADDEALSAVVSRMFEHNRLPDRVVHLWALRDEAPALDVESTSAELDRGVNTLLSLARALASTSQRTHVHVDVVSSGAFSVLGDERVVPTAAALGGPVKVIPLEYAGLSCRLVDLPLATRSFQDELPCLMRVLTSRYDGHCLTAVRGRNRWVHDLDPLVLDEADPNRLPIRTNGTYLIVGGLGGIGLSIGRHLAEKYGARLALTSRSGRPAPDPDNTETTRRLEHLAAIEQASPGTLVLSVDATDPSGMRSAIERVNSELGEIDGVIVAAAVPDHAGAIHRRSKEAAHAAIEAKVFGAVVLAEALRTAFPGRQLDFVLLSSSIASQLFHNRFGQVGYVTSNSFVEAMAECGAFDAERTVTVAWDDWVDVGMSVRVAQDFAERYSSGIQLMDDLHSFSPADGVRLFERALVAEAPTLFVSTTDLRKRVEDDLSVSNPFLEQALADDQDIRVEAGDSLGEALRSIWADLLGAETIGDSDDFFDLGGDSLQVARMADRLRRSVGMEVPLDLIFENTRLEDLVAELERLSTLGADDREEPAPDGLTGVLKLAPAQRRFLDRNSPFPSRFNVCAWLAPLRPLVWTEVELAAQHLVERHDALRTRFVQDQESGAWSQYIGGRGTSATTIDEIEVASRDELEALAARWQGGFDLEAGPIARIVLVNGREGLQRIFIGLHHLVSDRLSLLSMIDELDVLLTTGDTKALARPSLPSSLWPMKLSEYTSSEAAARDAARWDSLVVDDLRWPGDADAPNTNGLASDVRLELGVDTSTALLQGGVGRVDELVLLALGDALLSWTDSESVGIDVIGHGRRLIPGVDLSRTAGFFLSYSPIWLTNDSARTTAGRVEALRSKLERAWTFDPLRYDRPTPGTTRPRPRVLFNYVGRPIESSSPQTVEVVDEPLGDGNHPDNPRDHDLAVMATVDAGRVGLTIVYPTARLLDAQVQDLVDRLRQSIEALVAAPIVAETPGQAGRTP